MNKKTIVRITSLLLTLFLISVLHASEITNPYINKPLPIVLVHGILSDKHSMQPTVEYIQKYMPGVYIKNVTIGLGAVTSWWNMYDQAAYLANELQNDPNLRFGCNIIAHSQGGLVARYFVERYNNPRVYTYISWGSPQQGVFGTPGTLDDRFTWLNMIEQYTYRLLYSTIIQKYISFASYWHDPLHHDLYNKKCIFLPYLNNEKEHELVAQFKENICSLKHMVLVASDGDDIIEPIASCHFGFYKEGSSCDIEPLEDSIIYKNDTLGLRTLAESDRLHLKIAHCTHTDFQENEQNFVENSLPYLQETVYSAR